MSTQLYILLSVLIGCFILTIYICLKSRHFFSSVFMSAISGVGALLAVNIMSELTGVSIALNYITTAVSAVMGLPGVTALVLCQLIVK